MLCRSYCDRMKSTNPLSTKIDIEILHTGLYVHIAQLVRRIYTSLVYALTVTEEMRC